MTNVFYALAPLYDAQAHPVDPDPGNQQYQRVLEMAAQSMNHRAVIYMALGRYTVAEDLLKGALAIYERHFTGDRPEAVAVLQNYAALLRKMERVQEAQTLEAKILSLGKGTPAPADRQPVAVR